MKEISALLAGLIFGIGLTVSQMVNPAKVLAFLDIFGNWDPSLAIVMASALVVTFVGFRLTLAKTSPLFAENFSVPTNRTIDTRLAAGATLFGIGWGLVGLCPGPALTSLSIGGADAWTFFAAMVLGMAVFEAVGQIPPKVESQTVA